MLRIRRLPIDTYPDNTAFILRYGNGYSAEHFQALRKIRVTGEDCEILATLALVDDGQIIGDGEIGLGEQAFRRLGLPEGAIVEIAQARRPSSLEFVRRKIDGDSLGEAEIAAVVRDIANHRYSPMEISACRRSASSTPCRPVSRQSVWKPAGQTLPRRWRRCGTCWNPTTRTSPARMESGHADRAASLV